MNKNKDPNAKILRSSWQEFQDKRWIKTEFSHQKWSPTTVKRRVYYSTAKNRKQKQIENLKGL